MDFCFAIRTLASCATRILSKQGAVTPSHKDRLIPRNTAKKPQNFPTNKVARVVVAQAKGEF